MKHKFFAMLVLVGWTVYACAATPEPYSVPVTFSVLVDGSGAAIFNVNAEPGDTTSGTGTGSLLELPAKTAWMKPGKIYNASFAASGPEGYTMSFIAPDGYRLMIDGIPTNALTIPHPSGGGYTDYHSVELRPVFDQSMTPMGEFSGIHLGKSVTWSVGLGGLRTGRSAGRISFRETDLSSSPASRDKLYFSEQPNNGQISLVKDGPSATRLRQVLMAQAIVDLVDDSGGNGYTMKFYDWHASPAPSWDGLAGLWIFGGVSPWKTIRVESPGANQLKITEVERPASNTAARVSLLSLTSGSVSSGAYQWTLQEGDGTTWLRTVTQTSTNNSTGIMASGGTVTSYGEYTLHTLTNTGTFSVSSAPSGSSMDVLVVGGGGGGGGGPNNSGGGGGGGGQVVSFTYSPSVTSYTIYVGGGGGRGNDSSGSNGGDSLAFGTFARGGGGGGGYSTWGSNALGGGGGAGRDTGTLVGGGAGGGTNHGGNAGSDFWGSAGGGGGAGGAGADGDHDWSAWPGTYGNGGVGVASSITGTSTYYGGGGAGSWQSGGGGNPSGGLGGGGNSGGNGNPSGDGVNGLGGGGAGSQYSTPGYGGSGVVIVKFPATYYREVVEIVRTGGTSGTIVTKAKYRFENVGGWGEELVSTIADPDGAALTTSYTYHTNVANLGNYRRIRSTTTPTGNWSAQQYYDDWDRRGQVQYLFQPYLDSPSAVSLDPAHGRVTYFTYAADWTGHYTRPTLRQEKVEGVEVGRTTWSHGDTSEMSMPVETATVSAYRSASNAQQTYTETFREDASPDFIGGPWVVKYPDQRQDSYALSAGSFNHSTRVFTPSSSGQDFIVRVYHGSQSSGAGTLVNSDGSYSFQPLYLVTNKSTLDVSILSNSGLLLRKETYFYNGSSFVLTQFSDSIYQFDTGLPASVQSNNGALTEYTYVNNRLDSTKDPAGVTISFSYDPLGRVVWSRKDGIGSQTAYLTSGYTYPPQSAIYTHNVYDGANRVLESVSTTNSTKPTLGGGGANEIFTTSTYDLAGRLTQTVANAGSSNALTTGVSYSSSGKIVTATLPGGATKVSETYLDGQLKSVGGTAVICEYHSRWIDSGSGKSAEQITFGGVSAGWHNFYFDWLGRKIEDWSPRWDGNAWGDFWTYGDTGLLTKTSMPGQADTLYVYNTLGELFRQGLDVGGNGALDPASDDRITEFATAFSSISGSTYFEKSTYVYPQSSNSTPKRIARQVSQLSNLGSGVLSSIVESDVYGNEVTTTTSVDRPNKRSFATTSYPDSSTAQLTVSLNGLLVEGRDKTGVISRIEYDALARKQKEIDPRAGATTYVYLSGANLLAKVYDPAATVALGSNPSVTPTAQYTYDTAGRTFSVAVPNPNYNGTTDTRTALYSYTGYTARGETYRQWGDTSMPVEYGYDARGNRTTLSTFRGGAGWSASTWPSSPGSADTTVWAYHAPTSLLTTKTDAADKAVTYTYTVAGQIYVRAWARSSGSLTTTYSYSPATGELTNVNYSDSTPDLTYTYNRLGRTSTVQDGTAQTRTFNYNLAGTLELSSEDLPSYFGPRRLTYLSATSGVLLGRPSGLQLGTSGSPAADQSISYGYDTLGRFNTYTTGGQTFTYGYLSNSTAMVQSITSGSFTDTRGYDSNHDWTKSRETKWGTTTVANFDRTFDALGRAMTNTKTGLLFYSYGNHTQGLATSYTYDDRSQVTRATTVLGGSSTQLPGRQDGDSTNPGYSYDTAGNRTGTRHNGNAASYSVNALNQYTQRDIPGVYDVAGASSATTVTINSSTASRAGDYYFSGQSLSNTVNPMFTTLATQFDSTAGPSLDAFVKKTPELFSPGSGSGYDDDGNLLVDGQWNYTYDAENRLIEMRTRASIVGAFPLLPATRARRLVFSYDYLGRRIRKTVYDGYNAGTDTFNATPAEDWKFVYDGWNCIAKLNALSSNSLSVSYFWGLDLSGTAQGAGGVGGLLLIQDGSNKFLSTYDQMGNLHALLTVASATINGTAYSAGDIVAAYEYDAFGQTIRESGAYAAQNPFRYSTKFTDIESELVYYGLRYYSPSLGRFINRDPIEEKGGLNLYAFCSNNGVTRWDKLGMVEDRALGGRGEVELDGDGGSGYYNGDNALWWSDAAKAGKIVMNPTNQQRALLDALSSLTAAIERLANAAEINSGFQISGSQALATATKTVAVLAILTAANGGVPPTGSNMPTATMTKTPDGPKVSIDHKYLNPVQPYGTYQEALVAGAVRAAATGGAYKGNLADWRDTYGEHEYVWGAVKRADGNFYSTIATTDGEANRVNPHNNPWIESAHSAGTLVALSHNHTGGPVPEIMSGYGASLMDPYLPLHGDRSVATEYRVRLYMITPWGSWYSGNGSSFRAETEIDLSLDNFKKTVEQVRQERKERHP